MSVVHRLRRVNSSNMQAAAGERTLCFILLLYNVDYSATLPCKLQDAFIELLIKDGLYLLWECSKKRGK